MKAGESILLWTCFLLCQCQADIPPTMFPDTYSSLKNGTVVLKYVAHKKIVEVGNAVVAALDIDLKSPGLTINCKNVVYTVTYLVNPIRAIRPLRGNYSTVDDWLKAEGGRPEKPADKELLEKAWEADGECLKKALGTKWTHRIVHDPSLEIVVHLDEGGGSKTETILYGSDVITDVDGSGSGVSSGMSTSTLLLYICGGAIIFLLLLAWLTVSYMKRLDVKKPAPTHPRYRPPTQRRRKKRRRR